MSPRLASAFLASRKASQTLDRQLEKLTEPEKDALVDALNADVLPSQIVIHTTR